MKKIISLLLPLLALSSCAIKTEIKKADPDSSSQSSSSIKESTSSSSSTIESSSSESSSIVESSPEESSTSVEITPYSVTFETDEHVSVYVYGSQDYTIDPVLCDVAYSVDGDTGEYLNDGTGQVNFKLVYEEGYSLNGEIAITGEYGKLKGEADTGIANVYRITKVASDLMVTINSIQAVEPAYTVTFDCDEHVSVYVYAYQDYSLEPEEKTTAYSVVADTGVLTRDGTGQVNFLVVFDEGYTLDSMSHDEKNYKNLKGSEETEVDNVYRITKITGDFTLTITSKLIEE